MLLSLWLMLGGLQLECARVLDESLLMPVLMYGSETMIWKEMERSRIRAVRVANLRGFLGIRRIDKVPNARIRELCGVTKRVDKMFYEDDSRWFSHVVRIESDSFPKRVYIG